MSVALRKIECEPLRALPQDAPRSLHVTLAYNPEAGNFSASELTQLRDVLEQAGHIVTVQNSLEFRFPAHPARIDLACIVGGDGTARTVINRSRADVGDTVYCVYPAGTVNLVAREAGYRARPASLVRRLNSGADPKQHFLGEVNGKAFLSCASVGIDSAVVNAVNPAIKRRFGRLAYAVALLEQLWRWPRPRITVTVDGQSHAAQAVYICKSRYYAGPWVLDDRANLCADTFQVLLLDRAGRRDMVRLFLSAVISRRIANPRWRRLTARTVEISAPEGLPIQADGDIVAMTPASVRIAPEPLSFL